MTVAASTTSSTTQLSILFTYSHWRLLAIRSEPHIASLGEEIGTLMSGERERDASRQVQLLQRQHTLAPPFNVFQPGRDLGSSGVCLLSRRARRCRPTDSAAVTRSHRRHSSKLCARRSSYLPRRRRARPPAARDAYSWETSRDRRREPISALLTDCRAGHSGV